MALGKVGMNIPFSSRVFHPVWSKCIWVHSTTSISAGVAPCRFQRQEERRLVDLVPRLLLRPAVYADAGIDQNLAALRLHQIGMDADPHLAVVGQEVGLGPFALRVDGLFGGRREELQRVVDALVLSRRSS